MAKLPYSRVVNVTLSRNDAFPSRRGFGTPLHLTTVAKAGKVDATLRTKAYASMDEVSADWSPTDDFYKAANFAFAQNPRPLQIKAGYVLVDVTPTDVELQTQLDLLYAYDQDWYFISIPAAMRDTAQLDGLISWIETKNKIAMIDSNDVLMVNPADTTNIAARHKGTVERTAVFWHNDATVYMAIAAASYMATRNFDDANTAYTVKFKQLQLIDDINLGSAAVTAITGFTPQLGQSSSNGHLANTYIDIGDQNFIVEGSTLTQNVFLDEIHATDWIIARTEEEALGIFLNNARIPFTDNGMETLATAPRTVMRQGFRAGIVADDLNPETGLYEAAVTITVPSVFDVPESQRKARIAPAISVIFRYAGAVHYTTINYQMTF